MHFGVAQRFAALIAGVRQMSLKLSAKAPAGLPRSVRGYAAFWRGMVSERGVVSCYVPSAARSFAFGELAHIEALVFCVRAYGRVKEIRFRGAGAHRGACVLRPSSARVEHPGSGAGLLRSVRGYAGLWRGIASQGQGNTDFWRGMVSERGVVRAMYRAPRVHLLSGSWRTSRRLRFASKQRACRTSGQ